MPISKRPESLVVDANPILSALLGGKAKRIFFEAGIFEFAVADTVVDEVRRYIPKMAEKLGVSEAFLAYALDLLPLTCCQPKTYCRSLKKATNQIAHRDPNDIEILALALELNRPLWTNDKDFEGTTVEVVTTAELLVHSLEGTALAVSHPACIFIRERKKGSWRQLEDERKLEKALLVERVRGTGEGTDSLAVQLREGGAAMFDRTSTRSAPC